MALKRFLGVQYNTAWLMHQKIMQGLATQDKCCLLSGDVHIDDGYIGGRCEGGKRGRGSENKSVFIMGLSLKDGKPHQLKTTQLDKLNQEQVCAWAKEHIEDPAHLHSDALLALKGLSQAGFTHESYVIKDDLNLRDSLFMMMNTVMGNLKRYLLGIHHALSPQRLQRYLSAFSWRFNQRYDLEQAFKNAIVAVFYSKPLTHQNLLHELSA